MERSDVEFYSAKRKPMIVVAILDRGGEGGI
jgi:hypothetical protein